MTAVQSLYAGTYIAQYNVQVISSLYKYVNENINLSIILTTELKTRVKYNLFSKFVYQLHVQLKTIK